MTRLNRSIGATMIAFMGLSVLVSLTAGSVNAQTKPLFRTVSFQETESGMMHGCVTPDKHNCCAAGMNDALGHFVRTMAWTKVTSTSISGVVECKFSSGDELYGTVSLSAPDEVGCRTVTIQYTGGTGSFANVIGTVTGQYRGANATLGVVTYTGTLSGFLRLRTPFIPNPGPAPDPS
jgi:hypothetical protein